MLGLVVLATVVGGDNCAVESKLMQLLHWEQSGDTLVPVLHEESLVGNEMLARHVKISTLFFFIMMTCQLAGKMPFYGCMFSVSRLKRPGKNVSTSSHPPTPSPIALRTNVQRILNI